MSDSPAVIIFDKNGNPIGVVFDGYSYRLQTETRITDGYSYVGITDVIGAKALKVDVVKTVASGGAGSGGTSSNFDDPFPIAGTAVGYTDGYYMRDATAYDLNSGGGTEWVAGANLRTYANGGSVETGTISNPLVVNNNNQQVKTEYDLSSPTTNYVGTAPSGTAKSAAAWTIKKITFDGSGNPIETLWSSNIAIWNNRASETYS